MLLAAQNNPTVDIGELFHGVVSVAVWGERGAVRLVLVVIELLFVYELELLLYIGQTLLTGPHASSPPAPLPIQHVMTLPMTYRVEITPLVPNYIPKSEFRTVIATGIQRCQYLLFMFVKMTQ